MVLFIQKHIETSDLADTTKAGYVVSFNRLKSLENQREEIILGKYTYDVFCDFLTGSRIISIYPTTPYGVMKKR